MQVWFSEIPVAAVRGAAATETSAGMRAMVRLEKRLSKTWRREERQETEGPEISLGWYCLNKSRLYKRLAV